MIYGFVEDTTFLDPNIDTINPIDLNLPCGFMPPEIYEYFMEQVIVNDKRSLRLPISYRDTTYINLPESYVYDSLTYLLNDTIANLNNTSDETISLSQYASLDQQQQNQSWNDTPDPNNGPYTFTKSNMRFIIDNEKLIADQASFEELQSDDKKIIFNIIEYLYYASIPLDSLSDINNSLLADTNFGDSNDNYAQYKSGTVALSSDRSIVYIFDDNLNFHRFIPNWIQFTITIPARIINTISYPEYNLTFKFWISKSAFSHHYPLYNITKIIPPLPLSELLNPSGITSIYQAVDESGQESALNLTPILYLDNQSGYIGFRTLYKDNDINYYLTFGITYKGRQPTHAEARLAIKEYLINSGEGGSDPTATWKLKFPNLFVINSFYFIPIYDNDVTVPNLDFYPSIIDYASIVQRMQTVMSDITTDFSQLEIITVAYNKMFIGVINANGQSVPSKLNDIIPTYQDWDTTDFRFSNLVGIAPAFADKFNKALAVAIESSSGNNTNAGIFIENQLNDLFFYSFILDDNEFLVIRKAEYDLKINP